MDKDISLPPFWSFADGPMPGAKSFGMREQSLF